VNLGETFFDKLNVVLVMFCLIQKLTTFQFNGQYKKTVALLTILVLLHYGTGIVTTVFMFNFYL